MCGDEIREILGADVLLSPEVAYRLKRRHAHLTEVLLKIYALVVGTYIEYAKADTAITEFALPYLDVSVGYGTTTLLA